MTGPVVLVHLPNWIGDAALAAPALRALHRSQPGSRLVLVCHPRSAALYGRWPSDLLLVAGGRNGLPTMALAGRLRSLEIGAALVLPASFRAAVAPFLAGVRRRIGFAVDGRGLLLTEPVRLPARHVHLARQYLDLAARLGADRESPLDPILPVGEDEIEAQAKRLRAVGAAAGRSIALCPGATYGETKRWPVEHWIGLGRLLLGSGYSLLILGGPEDAPLGERIAGGIGPGARNLAGALALRETLALLRLLGGAVSNDSGAMHLAAASGCPVVGLFGSTNPFWTGPLGSRSRSLSLALPCSPCYARTCPTQIECLRDLEPARVARELIGLLEEGKMETQA